jgi:hypothetical protein
MSALLDELKNAWDYVSSIEPVLGRVSKEDLRRVEGSIKSVEANTGELEELDEEDAASAESALAVLYARAAAIAVAAGDEVQAHRWFDEGEGYAQDDAYAAQFDAGRKDPERFRKLVQGRYQIANNREREARALWREVVKAKPDDALAVAANAEQKAPRPLKDGQMPTLWTYNGIGVGFSGSRDRWEDGSYATTHCFKIIYIPIWPIGAYRVIDGEEDGNYYILAREPLSGFAKAWRWIFLASIVLIIAGVQISNHFNDPTRKAKIRWDDTIASVQKKPAEEALRELDARLTDDIWRVGTERAQKVGSEIMRITSAGVKTPFTRDGLDQAGRVVRRYEALPQEAKGGAARDTLLAALDKWTADLAETPENAEARLEMLRLAEKHADAKRQGPLLAKIESTRLLAADAKVESAPLEALAIYVERPSADALARANKIVEKLAESPALLADAGKDLETWMGATASGDALRTKVQESRDKALLAKQEAQDEKATPKQLEAMLKKNPWNQWAGLALANKEIEAGKLEQAADRLRAFGKPNQLVRDVRQTLGQLSSALGQLEEADELLTGLLGARLGRFQKVASQLDEAQKKVMDRLRTAEVPYSMQIELERANEEQRNVILQKWVADEMEKDATVKNLSEQYLALNDVVPAALAAGGVKLRRAQSLAGAARDAMLGEAERMFLAIRTEAEGQPEFRVGLGEIYARLGKTKESEEQFKAVLDMKQPDLSLRVARVYRNIGSTERAKEVAKQVFDVATSPTKDGAAVLLGIMSNGVGEDDEAEKWFRKADQKDPMVKTSLLEIEARRALRSGKNAECAQKYTLIAKQHLQAAKALDTAAYNNAAIAHQARYMCSGDPQALADAESTLEKAYRVKGDEPIVVANLADLHDTNSKRRVLAKRIDPKALQAMSGETDDILDLLLDSAERDAVLADMNADAGARRASELFKQYEVLAPNSTSAYKNLMSEAWDRRDEAALAALLDRAKKAKGLEVGEAATYRERLIKGELDPTLIEYSNATLARVLPLLQKAKDSKTKAALLVASSNARIRAALYQNDVDGVRNARSEVQEAGKLWPAIATPSTVIGLLVDEAGLTADSKAWIAGRRERGAIALLAKLAAENSPLAAKIKESKQWGEVRTVAATQVGRPGLDDLRVARLLGDAALETRAKAVLDDKLTRLSWEISLVLDPTSQAIKEDLALLDKR